MQKSILSINDKEYLFGTKQIFVNNTFPDLKIAIEQRSEGKSWQEISDSLKVSKYSLSEYFSFEIEFDF